MTDYEGHIEWSKIKEDHTALTKELAARRFDPLLLRLNFAILWKSSARIAAVYLALVIGLILLWAIGGLSNDTSAARLTSLITISVVFWVVQLVTNSN